MKTMRRVFATLLALVMTLSLTAAIIAATPNYSNGSGTIKITNTTAGETYSAYQIFGAIYNAETNSIAYTIKDTSPWYNAVAAASSPFIVTPANNTDIGNFVTVKENAEANVLDWLQGNFATVNPASAFSNTATGNYILWQNVPYGYYYITSTVSGGGIVTIDNVTPNAEVIDKNPNTPNMTKTLVSEKNSFSVGEEVQFKVEITNVLNFIMPEPGAQDPRAATEYIIVDNFDTGDFRIIGDTVQVTVTDFDGNNHTLELRVVDYNDAQIAQDATEAIDPDTIAYFTNVDGKDGMRIVIDWSNPHIVPAAGENPAYVDEYNFRYDAPATITLLYSAEVLDDITSNGTGTIVNHAESDYNYILNSGETGSDDINEDDVEVYSYYFDLAKVDGSDGTPLIGAEFELYDENHNIINLVEVPAEEIGQSEQGVAVYRVAMQGETPTVTEMTTPANGRISVRGLGDGTYYLRETQAPAGYNPLTEDIEVVIDGHNLVHGSIDHPGKIVENNHGAALPATGGIGTTIFTILGSVLVISAATLLITKKKMAGTKA